jgi:hypothetical protein
VNDTSELSALADLARCLREYEDAVRRWEAAVGQTRTPEERAAELQLADAATAARIRFYLRLTKQGWTPPQNLTIELERDDVILHMTPGTAAEL